MKVLICKTSELMSKKAAGLCAEKIKNKPCIVLGLATGSTPEKMYRELVRMHQKQGLDFSSATTFNLDEYLGLPGTHTQSYRYYMDTKLFNHINIDKARTYILNGMAADPEMECTEFEKKIQQAGGIDLQILGIGRNGHIGFNEPGSPQECRTRVVELSRQTIRDNSRFFKKREEVPRKALTMGIATILEAKEILLIADRTSKAAAVAGAVEGEVTTEVPGSFLQKHPQCTFLIDRDAASELKGSYQFITW
ncbi:MAG: glucosamine-6-phosphate deaminase [Spirochaetota bacterium]